MDVLRANFLRDSLVSWSFVHGPVDKQYCRAAERSVLSPGYPM